MIKQKIITLASTAKSFMDITTNINSVISEFNIEQGMCNVFIQHTSASLVVSENYDKDVLRDLETFMSRLVPENNNYRHNDEGKDDMPAHIRTVLTETAITLPIVKNKLALGTWQAVYLWEHRDHGHDRKIVVSVW